MKNARDAGLKPMFRKHFFLIADNFGVALLQQEHFPV